MQSGHEDIPYSLSHKHAFATEFWDAMFTAKQTACFLFQEFFLEKQPISLHLKCSILQKKKTIKNHLSLIWIENWQCW